MPTVARSNGSLGGVPIPNLLPRDPDAPDYAPLSADRVERLAGRVVRAAQCVSSGGYDRAGDARLFEDIGEWGGDVTAQGLTALLDEIDRLRNVESIELPDRPAGEWLVHLWGRSFATGEAEVASRGFFDVWDRPPTSLWVEVVSRPMPRGAAGEEIALLCFVPAAERARAREGREADPNGSLWTLNELSTELAAQLADLIRP